MKTKAEEIIEPALLEWFNIDEQMDGIKFITRGKCLEAMEEYHLFREKEKGEGKGDLIQYVTNLIYAAHDLGSQRITSPSEDRAWFEEQIKLLEEYVSLPAKSVQSVSDEDIEKWADSTDASLGHKRGLINGAKAHRDGQIPKK